MFNHLPTKEDPFHRPLLAFGERLVEAVRRRGPGESAVALLAGGLGDAARAPATPD